MGMKIGKIPSRGPIAQAVNWTWCSISIIFVGLRVYGRVHKSGSWRGLWWDDFCLSMGLFLFILTCALSVKSIRLGYGRHIEDIPIKNFEDITYWTAILSGLSMLTSAFSKTGVALMLWRVSRNTKWMRYSLVFIMAFTNILFLAGAIQPWVRCSPVEKLWKFTIEGTCYPISTYMLWGTVEFAWGSFVDFYLAALPWFIIPYLKISMREKVGIGIAMSAGCIAGIASAIKSALIKDLMNNDPSWDTMALGIWSQTEVGITFIVGCIPVIRVLFRDVYRHTTGRTGNRTGVSMGNGTSNYGHASKVGTARASTSVAKAGSSAVVCDAESVDMNSEYYPNGRDGHSGSQDGLVTEVSLVDYPVKKEEV